MNYTDMKSGDYIIIKHCSLGEIICKFNRIDCNQEVGQFHRIFYDTKSYFSLSILLSNVESIEIIDETQYRLLTS